MKSKITTKHRSSWDRDFVLYEETFEFEVPAGTTRRGYMLVTLRRNDRRLPAGHRFLGDVGVI
ncbi:hypothetical protein [Caenibacillus caldisaponilyticus]|uniref:hypothetical protein n=1 Tax=Caenibacillus caldisaponilyticus TaxID=1674942 RepID=UPI0009886CD3|nr:hypothetical protein [Caenibacillus caldisaponilyticus]